MDYTNQFLLGIGKEARKKRQRFWDDYEFSIRLSRFQGELEAGLWFRTSGCSYDHKGGCIMCDYSTGPYTKPKDMVEYVKKGLQKIPYTCNQLLISPSGSMLDENEVPLEALEGILIAASKTPHRLFSFETRADSITKEKIEFCYKYLGERFYRLFIGLECANDWIRKYCVNKQLSDVDFIKTVEMLKKKNIRIAANILINIPFLNEKENIELAVEGIKWAIDRGVDECFLFPVHIKKATPLSYLYEKNVFEISSLWSLVEIINRLGVKYYEHIRLSWYTSYGAYNVLASPKTCNRCYDKVISHIDKFAEYQLPEEIEYLSNISCDCKYDWKKRIDTLNYEKTIEQRVFEGYRILSDKFNGVDWWKEKSDSIYEELVKDAKRNLYFGVGGNIFAGNK